MQICRHLSQRVQTLVHGCGRIIPCESVGESVSAATTAADNYTFVSSAALCCCIQHLAAQRDKRLNIGAFNEFFIKKYKNKKSKSGTNENVE